MIGGGEGGGGCGPCRRSARRLAWLRCSEKQQAPLDTIVPSGRLSAQLIAEQMLSMVFAQFHGDQILMLPHISGCSDMLVQQACGIKIIVKWVCLIPLDD